MHLNIELGVLVRHCVIEDELPVMGVVGVSRNGILDKKSGKLLYIHILVVSSKSLVSNHEIIVNNTEKIFTSNPAICSLIRYAKTSAQVYELITEDELDTYNYFIESDDPQIAQA